MRSLNCFVGCIGFSLGSGQGGLHIISSYGTFVPALLFLQFLSTLRQFQH